jgi:uncharacterized protein (DUF2345 family)
LAGSTGGTTTANGSIISLGVTGLKAPGSTITEFDGIIIFGTPGTYQVTAGVMTSSAVASPTGGIQLQVASAVAPKQIIELQQASTENNMYSITTIIVTTATNTLLELVNETGQTLNLNNATKTATGAPAAYVTIRRLR